MRLSEHHNAEAAPHPKVTMLFKPVNSTTKKMDQENGLSTNQLYIQAERDMKFNAFCCLFSKGRDEEHVR